MSLLPIIIPSVVAAGSFAISVAALARRSPHNNRTYTVTDELIERMVPSGCYMIIGPQGVGKTSLMMAVMSTDFKYHGIERLQIGQDAVKRLNSIPQKDPYHLVCPPCAYRTRTKLILPNGKPTYHTDISQFGLPGKPGTQYFPKGTFIGTDEVDSFMDCRKWQEDKQSILDGFKYIRHNQLVLMMDAQNFKKCDIGIRRLVTDIWYVHKKKDIYEKRHRWSKHAEIVRTEWTFTWVRQQELENAMEIKAFDPKLKFNENTFIRECKFIYEGNIYRQYNSFSGEPYWYAGIKQYDIEKHPENSMSRDGIAQFIKSNSLRFEQSEEEQKPGKNNPSDEGAKR